ncbi:hypothetical protein IU468_26980 [Nocardia farcinica]|uniref:hypothetical protein n=1 Tax=Nocardia farcinica TaxID=37329 RepID=UPI0018952EE9|nr:hypothetical protein [Nocardia farcinica]MBF6259922.1 hypothetical protein [Nocardia farcinica]MBF6522624.1 hypothetical protein [Nocardia farcinica]
MALRKASPRNAVVDTLGQTYYAVRVSAGMADALVIHPDAAKLVTNGRVTCRPRRYGSA